MCYWNDDASSLTQLSGRLRLEPSPLLECYVRRKDRRRIRESRYKMTEKVKKMRKAARRKRTGLDDKHVQSEGVMYASGVFDHDAPGPSKRSKTN